jgi:hypothetical protein
VALVVDVEPEPVHLEVGLEAGQLGERLVELARGHVVGDGDVRVVGKAGRDGEGPAAGRRGQHLAVGDPVDDADEDHRGDRPEGARAAEPDPERLLAGGGLAQVRLDVGHRLLGHLRRRHQGDVGRDLPSRRVPQRDPERLQVRTERLRHRDRDTDRGHR